MKQLLRRSGKKWTAAASAPVVVLGLAACGGGSGSSGSEDFVVGIAAPLSGDAAVFGEPVDRVTRAAIEEVNEAGGIDGTMLRAVTEDEKMNAEDGVRVVTKLINNDNAQFITGVTSGTLMATIGLAQRNEVVIASPYSGIVEFDEQSGGNYGFRTVGPDSLDGLSIASNLYEQGFERIAIMSESSDSALSTSGYVKSFFEDLGGEVVDMVNFSPGQSSYLTEVRNAFANDPDAVFLAASGESATPILREANRLGLDPTWALLSELTTDQFAKSVGPDLMEGVYGQGTISATDSAAFEHMTEVLKDAYGDVEGEELVGTPSIPQDYDTMIVAALAMVAGGEASAEAINDNYREVGSTPGVKVSTFAEGKKEIEAGNEIDYEGASGSLEFNETGTAAPDYAIYQVKKGKFEVVETYSATELLDVISAE